MESIICPRCNSTDYYTELLSTQNVARCLKCNAFIKNIPYNEPQFYFGKYKGRVVSSIEDLSYLRWALANCKMSQSMRDAVYNHIHLLEDLSR
ncbi:MAG TPA: hypothetical protein VD794_03820 [Flavisolibacter sp.]|nr:hypothetical protein [Flavisolibacter sp.]